MVLLWCGFGHRLQEWKCRPSLSGTGLMRAVDVMDRLAPPLTQQVEVVTSHPSTTHPPASINPLAPPTILPSANTNPSPPSPSQAWV
jgi:hypothetical protein